VDSEALKRKLALLERLAVVVLLIAAAVPRAVDLNAGFDREFEGYQGAFFAIAAVNYERFGVGRLQGYPALVVDVREGLGEARTQQDVLLYENHPPTVPLLAWLAARTMGPAGWNEAWAQAEPPRNLEAPLRLPFLLANLLGVFLFWWALKESMGSAPALIGLALMAALPISVLYATLVNYENPALVCILALAGAYARGVRTGSRAWLACAGLLVGFGMAVTYAPAFFFATLLARAALKRERTTLAWFGSIGLIAGALPVLLFGWLAPSASPLRTRAETLLGPLLDGSVPFDTWLITQIASAGESFGSVLAAAGFTGFVIHFARQLSRRFDQRCATLEVGRGLERTRVDLITPLCLGGALYLLAFYRHTADPQRPFLMLLAPGAVAASAFLVFQFGRPLLRLRAGLAPVVVVVGAIVMPGLGQLTQLRAELRLPLADTDNDRLPLPRKVGAELAELLPPGCVALAPNALGLNLAATYYAWRNLLSVDEPRRPRLLESSLFLRDRPVYAVAPERYPPQLEAALAAWRTSAGAERAPDLRSDGWVAWRVD